jgi:pilus assembly protein CpaB
MGRRVKAVFAAMLVGLIGVAAVLVYASGADARAVADQRPQSVYVAQELIPAGTTAADAAAKGLMVQTKIAAKGVPAGALTAVDPATAKLVALTEIAKGDFVTTSRFGTTPKGAKAIEVPAGEVAMSVSLTDPGRVGSFMTPGSRIVIYDTFPDAAGTKLTRVLLDDVLVIAIGSTSLTPLPKPAEGQAAPDPAASGSLVTVALPPATAPKLVHGIQTGTLYAALSNSGTKSDLGQIISDKTLFAK